VYGISTPDTTSTAFDRLLNRLLRMESDDLVRLVGISGENLRCTEVRAGGHEQPARLL
jgi:hypothetical protein